MATADININIIGNALTGEKIMELMSKIRGVEPTPIYDTLVEEFWPRRWITLDTTGKVRFLDESLH